MGITDSTPSHSLIQQIRTCLALTRDKRTGLHLDLMIERIRAGVKPSEILRELKEQNPDADKWELSSFFLDEFPNAPVAAVQAIWYWQDGLSDDALDKELRAILLEGKE